MIAEAEWDEPRVTQQTLAAWRAQLVKIRVAERETHFHPLAESGRLLEIVGQALAQGDAPLPPADIARLEELTKVEATYR